MAKKLRQKRRTKTDNLTKKQQELERLGLEIKEREWNVSLVGKLVKLAPLFTPLMLTISILASIYWYTKQWNLQIEQQRLETERQRQETITNLKRELASENPAIRIGAALALTNYPKEAIPVLISNLGNTDIAFTNAIKHSLIQIGKDAVIPLIEEIRNIQRIVEDICLEDINLKELEDTFSPFDLVSEGDVLLRRLTGDVEKEKSKYSDLLRINTYTLLNKPEELIEGLRNLQPPLMSILPETTIEVRFSKEEVEHLVSNLHWVNISMSELKIIYKNILEALGLLLCKYHVDNLHLYSMDISSIDLRGANLSETYLPFLNLTNACLNWANLSKAKLLSTKLSYAKLIRAKLSDANMTFSDLSHANLTRADISGANLQRANMSRAVLSGANLSGANLSRANLSGAVLWKNPFEKGTVVFGGGELLEKYKTKLSRANLEGAILQGIIGFRDIVDFNETNLKDVKGLSREDLEYAKSKGAIIE